MGDLTDKIDDTDLAILGEMVENSAGCTKELAERLGVHPNTLLLRVKRLKAIGAIIKPTTVLDYGRLGYPTEALIFIKVKVEGNWRDHLQALARFPQVVFLVSVTGEYDAVTLVRLRSERELAAVIESMQDNPIVTKTLTQVVLGHWKKPHEFNLFRPLNAPQQDIK